jgi:cysteine desulfurase / selenocysteine lyase
MRRKEFLAACAAGMAGGMIPPRLAHAARVAGAPWPAGSTDDEGFWTFLREQFPLRHDRMYMNTGGLGASPYAVIDTVKSRIDEQERLSEPGESEELWNSLKGSAAGLLGCNSDELAFMRNTTEGINVVANGMPLKDGDEVILTTHEHIGGGVTWLPLAERKGLTVRRFEPSTASAGENLARLEKLITRRTRLIAVPHIVTTTGLVMPVKEICTMARSRNIWTFLDGAQSAGMMPFSLHDIGCDAYATSGHKWLLGPKETGFLYVRKEMQDRVTPLFIGAYSALYDFIKFTYSYVGTAMRYEYGTVSIALRSGLGAAIDFIQRIGIDAVWKRDRMLADHLYEGLRSIPGVTVLSSPISGLRSAMTSFTHKSHPYLEIQKHLETKYNMRTRGVSEGGLGAVRISTHIYNTLEEVDCVLAGVRSL